MHSVRVGNSAREPKAFVKTNRVHNERVAFPSADGVTVVTRIDILRMLPPIHINHSKRVRPADIHNENALLFCRLDELDSVWRQELARPARGFAARVRLELIASPIGV